MGQKCRIKALLLSASFILATRVIQRIPLAVFSTIPAIVRFAVFSTRIPVAIPAEPEDLAARFRSRTVFLIVTGNLDIWASVPTIRYLRFVSVIFIITGAMGSISPLAQT